MWRPCARTAKVVDKQFECGLNVEAMMLPRPGGEAWVGATPHSAAVGVFFLCPSVLFPSATKNEVFARRFFMENLMVIVNMFVTFLHRVYE